MSWIPTSIHILTLQSSMLLAVACAFISSTLLTSDEHRRSTSPHLQRRRQWAWGRIRRGSDNADDDDQCTWWPLTAHGTNPKALPRPSSLSSSLRIKALSAAAPAAAAAERRRQTRSNCSVYIAEAATAAAAIDRAVVVIGQLLGVRTAERAVAVNDAAGQIIHSTRYDLTSRQSVDAALSEYRSRHARMFARASRVAHALPICSAVAYWWPPLSRPCIVIGVRTVACSFLCFARCCCFALLSFAG